MAVSPCRHRQWPCCPPLRGGCSNLQLPGRGSVSVRFGRPLCSLRHIPPAAEGLPRRPIWIWIAHCPTCRLVKGSSETAFDLTTTGIVDPARVLSPPDGNLPVAQRQRSLEVQGAIASAFASSAASEAVPKSLDPKVATKLGTCVLPMASESSFY